MKNYLLLIGDGNAAASRGCDKEWLYAIPSYGENINEAIDNCQDQIKEIESDYSYFDEASEEDPNLKYSEYFNDLDPGAGDVWLIAYLEDGKLVDLGLDEDCLGNWYEFENYEDADKFGIPPYRDDEDEDDEDEDDEDDEE